MALERVIRPAAAAARVPAGLAAAAQFAVTGEDQLRVNVVHRELSASSLRVQVSARYLLAGSSTIRALTDAFEPRHDGVETTHLISIGDATLLNVAVRAIDGIAVPGQCFARLEVVRGSATGDVLGVLLAGYIGSWGGLGWPGTPLSDPSQGSGWVHVEQSSVPAAGANPSILIPEQTRWRILAVRAILTTSAAITNRQAYCRIFRAAQVLSQSPSSAPQGASNTIGHFWGSGASGVADPAGQIGVGSLPTPLDIAANASGDKAIDLLTVNLQPADQWDILWALVEEWRNPSLAQT